MTPIINPWIFYLIDIGGNLGKLCVSMIITGMIFFIVHLIALGLSYCDGDLSENEEKIFLKWFKRLLTIITIGIVGVVFIPSRETMYTMLVAQTVTYENVESVGETIKDSVDYIFDKINEEEKQDEE